MIQVSCLLFHRSISPRSAHSCNDRPARSPAQPPHHTGDSHAVVCVLFSPSTPAMLGNVVLWKPASTSVLANWVTYQILLEAGLPPGVIQFLPGEGRVVSPPILGHRDLS